MILLGVGLSIAVVVFVGFMVSKRIAGDSANATLGNTDLAAEFGFWAGACLPLGG